MPKPFFQVKPILLLSSLLFPGLLSKCVLPKFLKSVSSKHVDTGFSSQNHKIFCYTWFIEIGRIRVMVRIVVRFSDRVCRNKRQVFFAMFSTTLKLSLCFSYSCRGRVSYSVVSSYTQLTAADVFNIFRLRSLNCSHWILCPSNKTMKISVFSSAVCEM